MKNKARFELKNINLTERLKIKSKANELGGTAYMVNGKFIVEVPRQWELFMFRYLNSEGHGNEYTMPIFFIVLSVIIPIIIIMNWYFNLCLFAR